MALIVVDNVASAETVTIYDLDDVAAPLWLQVTATSQASPYHDFWRAGRVVNSIAMLNGVLCFGVDDNNDQEGLKVVDFAADTMATRGTATGNEWNGYFDANIANRNSTTKVLLGNTFNPIVHDNVNDVAMTVLEGSPIGALGLPIPTVAVACNSPGVSVIHSNGDVYNFTIGSYGSNAVAWNSPLAHTTQTQLLGTKTAC